MARPRSTWTAGTIQPASAKGLSIRAATALASSALIAARELLISGFSPTTCAGRA